MQERQCLMWTCPVQGGPARFQCLQFIPAAPALCRRLLHKQHPGGQTLSAATQTAPQGAGTHAPRTFSPCCSFLYDYIQSLLCNLFFCL